MNAKQPDGAAAPPRPASAAIWRQAVVCLRPYAKTAFLAALALEPTANTHDLAGGDTEDDDDVLVLSTVHSAKGKEWDAVFVTWAVDGWFPTTRSLNDDAGLDEERRLMYVALTRARRYLAVTYPIQVYGGPMASAYSVDRVSRFIDPSVRELMRRIVVEPQPAALPLSPSARAALMAPR